MFKEKPKLGFENFNSVKDLSPETKIKMILDVFDLGKDKKTKQEKERFF